MKTLRLCYFTCLFVFFNLFCVCSLACFTYVILHVLVFEGVVFQNPSPLFSSLFAITSNTCLGHLKVKQQLCQLLPFLDLFV